jgi:F-type H+-transporting ATPase subunit epsilon
MADREMKLRLVSPEGILYEGAFTDLRLPAYDGLRGFLPGHGPFVGKLGIGEMRILRNGESRYFGLYGGFYQVTPGRVEVVVDRADDPADLDVESCRREIEELARPRRRDVNLFEQEQDLRRIAKMRLRLAELSAAK